MASASRERTRMSLSPSPNKSKYHMRRALKLTAVVLVVVLVFRWRYGGQSAPVLHPAAAGSGERIEEKEPVAAVHIYDRHEEDLSAASQVNEGSWAPSLRDENSSGSTQSSIPSFLDYYDDDKSSEGDLNPVDDAADDKNGFFNIFNIFGGQDDSVEDGTTPEGGSEEKLQGGNATEASADGAKAEDGGINAGNNQSSVAEPSQNATGEREAQQDSKGEGEASANSSATKAEDDVSKVPSEVQPSIAPDVEKAAAEGSDVGTTKTDAEQIAEPDNGSPKVDADIEKVENSATSGSQGEVVMSQVQDVARTAETQEIPTHEETELPKHEETELPRQGTELPRQGTELPRQGTDLPRQGTELPNQGTELPRQETDLPRHTDVIEDSIGRLGDLIGGIRDVVEVLKKTKDTPVSEGGEDPQQQQVGGAEGNLTSSKHEALKPGGKLHGHISELLMLTGHLTDLLRESQKGREEQDELQTKDDAEGILQPASVSQGTEAQDTQMGEPIASPANPDEPTAPHTNQMMLEVTPMEPETQDENKQVLETIPETLAPSDVKENPVNQTQEPEDLLDPRYTSDKVGTQDTVKRSSGFTEREPVANGWLEIGTPSQNSITNPQERDGTYVEPASAVQVQEAERVDPSKIQEITGEIQERGTLQEQTHDEQVEPEFERLEPVDADKQEAATNTLQEQATDLVEIAAIKQEGERVEPVNILQEQAGEQMKPISIIEKQGEPMQPVEPEKTLQEQADKPVEPAGVMQEGSRVEPIVDGIQGGEPASQVNTVQEQTGEHLESGNTAQEETGVRSQSTDALQREAGELREPVNATLEPASERLEPAIQIQEPLNERTEPVPAAQEPTTNAEEPKYQNREPGNGDQVDNVNNMLANLKNMVHGLHSRLDNIHTKNQENATSEPEENRLSGGQISEPNNPQTNQVGEPLRPQSHYLEPENQRLEIENPHEKQGIEQENNGIDGDLMKVGGGGEGGEKGSERLEGESQNKDEENARKDEMKENGEGTEGETKQNENEQERQLQTYKEGEKTEEGGIAEGIDGKENEVAWQEDRRRRLREACRSRNPETDESVNATLHRSLYIQRSHTLVCAVPKAGLDTWKRTIEGLASKGHDDQTRSSPSSPALLDLASLDLSTKIITVKHPMARLFSSFLSKYQGGNTLPPFPGHQGDVQTEAGQEWLDNYRQYWLPALQINQALPIGLHLRLGLPNPLNPDTRYEPEVYERLHEQLHPNISFTSFVRFVVHTFRSGTQRPDWASYESSCSPCRVQYDHVAKVETLEDDLAYISKELNLPTTLDPEEAYVEARRAAATLELSLKYYMMLPLESRDELLQYLRPDMELFGYKAPLAMRPSSATSS